jgi:hypothetical protein
MRQNARLSFSKCAAGTRWNRGLGEHRELQVPRLKGRGICNTSSPCTISGRFMPSREASQPSIPAASQSLLQVPRVLAAITVSSGLLWGSVSGEDSRACRGTTFFSAVGAQFARGPLGCRPAGRSTSMPHLDLPIAVRLGMRGVNLTGLLF